MRLIANDDIRKTYKFGKILGAGSFGTVRIATRHNMEDKFYAVKSLEKS